MRLYKVSNHPFNQEHFPTIIGKVYEKPPAYARVKMIEAPMKFSAKDYNFVAKRFRENYPAEYDISTKEDVLLQRTMFCVLILDFAEAFEKDNPRFDPLKFLDACSPDVYVFPLSELWESR